MEKLWKYEGSPTLFVSITTNTFYLRLVGLFRNFVRCFKVPPLKDCPLWCLINVPLA